MTTITRKKPAPGHKFKGAQIVQAGGQPRCHAKPGLDLAQRQNPGIRGKFPPVKTGGYGLAANR